MLENKKNFKEKSGPLNRGYKPEKSEHSIPKPKTVKPVIKPKKD
ncbi:hypothetical protein [Enterococcus sp. CWB-B31]|nr:hypothetical protein [Enterococcus sp. CWB-B31]